MVDETLPGARDPILAFAAVVLCFVSATGYAEYRALGITRRANDIADLQAPAIAHLAEARAELRRFQALLRDYTRDRDAAELTELGASWQRAAAELQAYEELLPVAGRDEPAVELRARSMALRAAVERFLTTTPPSDEAQSEIVAAADRTNAVALRLLELHAARSRAAAVQIRHIRATALGVAFVLDALAMIVTIGAAGLLIRSLRSHARIVAAQHRAVRDKAEELELFSSRLAHDVAGPISASLLALDVVARAISAEERALALARAQRSLLRVNAISQALLEFARSGARPAPDARCALAPVLHAAIEDLQPVAASARLSLSVEPLPEREVACAAGILTMLIQNLVQNAIKYASHFPDPRVVVRAHEESDGVRVEVEDNGGGLPPDLERRVFEPYVRGPIHGQQGVGLGLATVKRMATAHGGAAGVRNRPGEGCTFWFELPRAAAHAAHRG